jgi:hypothetical protein
MAEDLHSFITGGLWLKLQEDLRDFQIFSRRDLICAAYYHIRRLLLTKPGWSCRADLRVSSAGSRPILTRLDLTLFSGNRFQALLQFEFHVSAGTANGFPASQMNEKMSVLRRTVVGAEQLRAADSGTGGRGYLVGVYDSTEEWFYPDQAVWEKQSCFWLPVNCRTFADYSDWRQKWERLARLSNR